MKRNFRDLNLISVRQYITMSVESEFIFVKLALSFHSSTVQLYLESLHSCHASIGLRLTKINADIMLLVMDYLILQNFKYLQMYFHNRLK